MAPKFTPIRLSPSKICLMATGCPVVVSVCGPSPFLTPPSSTIVHGRHKLEIQISAYVFIHFCKAAHAQQTDKFILPDVCHIHQRMQAVPAPKDHESARWIFHTQEHHTQSRLNPYGSLTVWFLKEVQNPPAARIHRRTPLSPIRQLVGWQPKL
jgi:hypothetical protein